MPEMQTCASPAQRNLMIPQTRCTSPVVQSGEAVLDPADSDAFRSRQVYGAYKYPRAQMHQLRPGAAVAQAGPMTPQTLTSPADGATRRVGPFEMKPQVALRCVNTMQVHATVVKADGASPV